MKERTIRYIVLTIVLVMIIAVMIISANEKMAKHKRNSSVNDPNGNVTFNLEREP